MILKFQFPPSPKKFIKSIVGTKCSTSEPCHIPNKPLDVWAATMSCFIVWMHILARMKALQTKKSTLKTTHSRLFSYSKLLAFNWYHFAFQVVEPMHSYTSTDILTTKLWYYHSYSSYVNHTLSTFTEIKPFKSRLIILKWSKRTILKGTSLRFMPFCSFLRAFNSCLVSVLEGKACLGGMLADVGNFRTQNLWTRSRMPWWLLSSVLMC